MKQHKFYRCKHCKSMVGLINDGGGTLVCCGEDMEELVANSVEASGEKHIPAVTVNGNEVTVQIGSVLHPAQEEHHIEFIYLATKHGGQRKSIPVGEEPIAKFILENDAPDQVLAYCNLHGLWKADV